MDENSNFVELDRQFRKLDPCQGTEESALDSYVAAFAGIRSGLDWKKLLDHQRVVVLGEPGSGKSWEFRERARILRAKGSFALFIPLDRLATEPWETTIGSDNLPRFISWQRSGEDGTFFMDSVDEAKFRKESDFYRALDRFRNALGDEGVSRAKILISSRISEWRPQTDKSELLLRFPVPPAPQERPEVASNPRERNGQEEAVLVVCLEPLDRQRVEQFAITIGVQNSESFVEALDQMHAWEFARRPLDVIDLANFWSNHRRVGSLTELIEHSTTLKLRELRDRDHPLTDKQARDGVEALAAATILCRQFHFKVPDEANIASGTLDARACLPEEWKQEECFALLTRAVFESAIYGRIRFHHRRIAEYLAAQWLGKKMLEGCPIPILEDILFSRIRNQRVLRQSLAPVAAWLCCGDNPWNEHVRAWVLETAPRIHLQHGDPGGLSVAYKRMILQALVKQYSDRSHVWVESTPDALCRLADPSLSLDIAGIARNKSVASDLRAEMLQLVRHGKLVDCLDVALEIIADPTESEGLKVHAVVAINVAGTQIHRLSLADITSHMTTIPERLGIRLCETLYPSLLDSAGLCNLLQKIDVEAERTIGLPWHLKSLLGSVIQPDTAGILLARLNSLLQTPPLIDIGSGTSPISQRYAWIEEILQTVLILLLRKKNLTEDETEDAAHGLWLLGHARKLDRMRDEIPDLNSATERYPIIRQRCLWEFVSERRQTDGKEPTCFLLLFDHHEVLRAVHSDLEWLIRDIQERHTLQDREVAFNLAVDLWHSSGRHWRDRSRIRHAILNDHALAQLFRKSAVISPLFWIKVLWYRKVVYRRGNWWLWKRRFHQLQDRWRFMKGQWLLIRHLRLLASGKHSNWLYTLAQTADNERSNLWTPRSWQGLRKIRGRLITKAAREGCKNAWREFAPLLPHEKTEPNRTDGRVIIGLAGLQAAIDDGNINFAFFNDSDARLAIRYAVNELNGFAPWLPDLAKHHPQLTTEILSECIRGEWQFGANREHHYEVLERLIWQGSKLAPLIRQPLLDQLVASDPQNSTVLWSALTLLLTQNEPPISQLTNLAANRARMHIAGTPAFAIWLGVWLQLDAQAALRFLNETLGHCADADRLVMEVCAMLRGDRTDRSPLISNPDYAKPKNLRVMIPLVYRHIRLSDDIDHAHGGIYSPCDRDHAQDFRNGLITRLDQSEDSEAETVLQELIAEPGLAHQRDWILNLHDKRAERQADSSPWTPNEIRAFAKENEVNPKTDRDLFSIACRRLSDIKHDVEKADISLREDLHRDDDEYRLRRWFARELQRRSRNRYTVPQEEEIDLEQRPDLRVECPGIAPVSIEIKWADSWPVEVLLERLENQLIGQYLRAYGNRYGIYLLGYIGKKHHWLNPLGGPHLSFNEVLTILREKARTIVSTRPDVADIAIVGVDFTDPRKGPSP